MQKFICIVILKSGMKKTLSSTSLEGTMITKTLDKIQKRRESLSYSRRKSSNQYDDVVDCFRRIYYSDRERLLEDNMLGDNLSSLITTAVEGITKNAIDEGTNTFDITKLDRRLYEGIINPKDLERVSATKASNYVSNAVTSKLNNLLSSLDMETQKKLRKRFLQNADTEWANLCNQIDSTRKGAGLAAFMGQTKLEDQYRSEIEPRFQDFTYYTAELFIEDLVHIEELQRRKKQNIVK